MKIKTSVTISDFLLEEIDHFASPSKRSSFIEYAIQAYIEKLKRQRRDKKDLKIINSSSRKLNDEAADVLDFQVKM